MPIATVAAIIKNDEEKILLTRRNVEPFKGQWCLPGGHIDQFEKVEDAVIREVKEETGLDYAATFLNYSNEIIEERNIHAAVMVFTGYGTGQIKTQESEVSNIDWFSLEEARSLPLAFQHNKILDEYYRRIPNKETHAELLAEYSALRSEILKRMDMRQQILTFTLIAAGTIFSFGHKEVLLLFPVLVLFLAALWTQNDTRIWEIAEFIKNKIEPTAKGIKWETYMYEKHKNQPVRFLEINSSGVFLISGIIAIILAQPDFQAPKDIWLSCFSGIAILITFVLLGRRSKAMKHSEK